MKFKGQGIMSIKKYWEIKKDQNLYCKKDKSDKFIICRILTKEFKEKRQVIFVRGADNKWVSLDTADFLDITSHNYNIKNSYIFLDSDFFSKHQNPTYHITVDSFHFKYYG